MSSRSEDSAVGLELRPISADDAQAFRRRVLRPPKREDAAYPGDDAPETLHLGAFTGPALVAVATVCRESMPDGVATSTWRLRGMATLDQFRGRGLGKRLLEACVAHAVCHGGDGIWCTARESAIAFYCSAGFQKQGNPFSLPQYTNEKYWLMRRILRTS